MNLTGPLFARVHLHLRMMMMRSTLQSNLILVLADDNKGNDIVI